MPLYHYQVGFPKGLTFRPCLGLVPSEHAQISRYTDQYGVITLPKAFLPAQAKVIEVETDEVGRVVKILARQPHDPKHDVVYAFMPDTKVLKTAWLQDKNDAHRTLQRWKYDSP